MRRTLAGAALALLSLQAAAQEAPPVVPAFLQGERLTYAMTILGIAAGEVVLSASRDASEGRPAIRLEMTIATNDTVSKIFLVRDRLTSWIDPDALTSLCFQKHTTEGGRVREEVILFDAPRQFARRGDKVIPFTPPAFDSLSSVYFVRTMPLENLSQTAELAVVAKDAFRLRVDVQDKETINTPAGVFRTIRVEPRSPGENLIGKGKNLVLWLTDDERRLPVQIKSKLTVGTLVGKLKEIAGP